MPRSRAWTGPLQDWPKAVELASERSSACSAPRRTSRREALLQGRTRPAARCSAACCPSLEAKVSDIGAKMKQGKLSDLQPGASTSSSAASWRSGSASGVGDTVNGLRPRIQQHAGRRDAARRERFTVVGIFEAGAQEYDLGLALVHLDDAQKLMRMGDGVTGVRLKLDDLWKAWPVARDLAERMDDRTCTGCATGRATTPISSAR